MTLLTILLIVLVILAVVGLGWSTFAVGVLDGFDRMLDVGIPIIKNLTQEAQALVYESQESNFKIQYPDTWMTESKGLPNDVDVIIFPQEFAYEPHPSVVLAIQNMYNEEPLTANISEIAEGAFDVLEAEPTLRIINTTSNATVTLYNGTKTVPASIIHAYDFGGLTGILGIEAAQEMDISTIIDKQYLVTFEYDASRQNFTKYLPEVQEMIKSFQLLTSPK